MSICKICGGNAGFLGVICRECIAKKNKERYERIERNQSLQASVQAKSGDHGDATTKESSVSLPELMVSTTDSIDGQETIRNLGVVRASTVRSRHVGSDIGASLKSIVGGELRGVTKLISDAREQSFARMLREAESLGANAVIGIRFTTTQIWEGAAEVLAYGTAVLVVAEGSEPIQDVRQ